MRNKDIVIEDKDFTWLINVAAVLRKKPAIKPPDLWKIKLTNKDDPFLPPFEDDLVVEYDFTKKHRIVLNKFPIAEKHILIITKEFEKQTISLDYEDIEACLITMRAQDPGFIFFNWGRVAGASQPHKHMQWFPESNFTQTFGKVPLSIALQKYLYKNYVDTEKPFRYPGFDFKHEIIFFQKDLFKMIDKGFLKEATEYVLETYQNVMNNLELEEEKPYSFCMTKDYIFIIPRKQEYYKEKVSWNSLCYIGTFFVGSQEKLELIKEAGPLEVLKEVSFPLE